MKFCRLLLPLLLLLVAAVPPAAAEDGQRVILVLDASGSMWGQIDGKTKIEIAKSVVGKVVGNWKPDDELGLVAYGHRKKGACDDIETLIEPGKLDAKSFMSAVKGLSPKGKTPMTQAIRQAAESLKYTERQATVILVSDGIETCDPDPCAVAAELEKLGVALTVHTVGFGLDDKGAVAQLQCLAEKTGGISVLAENADELDEAITKTVEAKTEPAPPAPEPEPVAPAFNLTGHVTMAEGVELPKKFDSPAWALYHAVGGEPGERVTTEYGPDLKLNVEKPGDYILKLNNDLAELSVPLTLTEGTPVRLELSFEAGMVRFIGMMDAATKVTDDGAAWALHSTAGDRLTTKYGPEEVFFANAGTYKMMLSLGTAQVEEEVIFTAGKIEDKSMMLGAGVLDISGVFTPGGPSVLDGAAIELREGKANIDGNHERISTNYGSKTKFDVPAGKYLIVVNQDYATGSAEVEAKAGAVTKVEVSVNGGFLAVSAAQATTFEVFSATKDISGNREKLATEYGDTLNKAFNAGSYVVKATGADGVELGEKTFEVKAGERVEGSIP